MVDLGTGDGRFVLHTARRHPETLVIGADADASSMIEISRKASREKLPNALFVVAAVENLPRELDGVADSVRIHFPWGSLLRGITSADAAIVEPVARLCGTGGAVTALVSIMERDARVGARLPDDPAGVALGFGPHGLHLIEMRPATQEEVASTRSSWAKRLGAGTRRPVTLLRWTRTLPGHGRASVGAPWTRPRSAPSSSPGMTRS